MSTAGGIGLRNFARRLVVAVDADASDYVGQVLLALLGAFELGAVTEHYMSVILSRRRVTFLDSDTTSSQDSNSLNDSRNDSRNFLMLLRSFPATFLVNGPRQL
jgi:hypothetical protein